LLSCALRPGIERGVSALANAAAMAPPKEADRLLA
jgi:hypothetical protein